MNGQLNGRSFRRTSAHLFLNAVYAAMTAISMLDLPRRLSIGMAAGVLLCYTTALFTYTIQPIWQNTFTLAMVVGGLCLGVLFFLSVLGFITWMLVPSQCPHYSLTLLVYAFGAAGSAAGGITTIGTYFYLLGYPNWDLILFSGFKVFGIAGALALVGGVLSFWEASQKATSTS